MSCGPEAAGFRPLRIAVLTVSDTRTEDTDTSGALLVGRLRETGHELAAKTIVKDDVYAIRAVVATWFAAPDVDVVLTTGGTGVTGRDGTPEAIRPLLDKEIEGFGEVFRTFSLEEIGLATLQSRAMAGVCNGTYLFCLPGSKGACAMAWDRILREALDLRSRPCNFAQLIPRLRER